MAAVLMSWWLLSETLLLTEGRVLGSAKSSSVDENSGSRVAIPIPPAPGISLAGETGSDIDDTGEAGETGEAGDAGA